MTPELNKLLVTKEAERVAVLKRSKILLLIGIPLLIVGVALLILDYYFSWPSVVALICLFILVGGTVVTIIGSVVLHNFKKGFLDALTIQVRNDLFPNAKVLDNEGLKYETMMKPGFFATPDRYLADHYMSAVYDSIPFEQSHFRLQKRQETTDGHGHTTVTYSDYAVGTMYHFSFQRDFGNTVKILEKQGIIGFAKNGLTKVETEYIEFNRKFTILTSDETTVFFILTPQIQEKIMSLEGKFKGKFFMAFMGHELFICVDDSDASITIDIHKPINEENLGPTIECLAIPSVFIKLLGLSSNKFKKNLGVSDKVS